MGKKWTFNSWKNGLCGSFTDQERRWRKTRKFRRWRKREREPAEWSERLTPGQSGWLGAAAVGSIPALALSLFLQRPRKSLFCLKELRARPWMRFTLYLQHLKSFFVVLSLTGNTPSRHLQQYIYHRDSSCNSWVDEWHWMMRMKTF